MKDIVFEFWYCGDLYEGGNSSISLHKTREGAETFMRQYVAMKLDEHMEIYEDEDSFGSMECWGIKEREILN